MELSSSAAAISKIKLIISLILINYLFNHIYQDSIHILDNILRFFVICLRVSARILCMFEVFSCVVNVFFYVFMHIVGYVQLFCMLS